GRPITALVLITGTGTTFYSNNPDTPEGHHWDSSGPGTSDYEIEVFSPELATALLRNPKPAVNEEIATQGEWVFFRNAGQRGFYQAFPQFESLGRRWENVLGRAIDFRLRLSLMPIAQLPDPPAVGPGPILLLRRG